MSAAGTFVVGEPSIRANAVAIQGSPTPYLGERFRPNCDYCGCMWAMMDWFARK
jgi:hypothetical protein